ncbi:hypothetical protein JQN72_17770 [Phycicoccus sp. CSK15P-2]|uniref:hypothetical protein n=1 Tax=Phycicoccus sp. CSK15P-2 TaxID=2807627 RepID=UPI00194E098A|nr:hypothetical protein [Phycicoccus sp. CSK15P-2]MBM6406084.1 hypothetical protein [Phycicoccus sp. CSK15P-2]
MTSSDLWDADAAARYDDASAGMFAPDVLGPTLDALEHVGFDTYDPVTQRAVSHHYTRQPDGSFRHGLHHFRYVWPAELDLMARLAGMTFESRHADWQGSPFTAESESHVSVWRRDG